MRELNVYSTDWEGEGPYYVEADGVTQEEARQYLEENYGDSEYEFVPANDDSKTRIWQRDACPIFDSILDSGCPCPTCPIKKQIDVWQFWFEEKVQ